MAGNRLKYKLSVAISFRFRRMGVGHAPVVPHVKGCGGCAKHHRTNVAKPLSGNCFGQAHLYQRVSESVRVIQAVSMRGSDSPPRLHFADSRSDLWPAQHPVQRSLAPAICSEQNTIIWDSGDPTTLRNSEMMACDGTSIANLVLRAESVCTLVVPNLQRG